MARAFWKGAISFGLVYIPVELYSATHSATIDLDYLDKRDFSPVGYQRYNKRTGKLVEWKDIVRGYQYKKGQYVALSDEDDGARSIPRGNGVADRPIEIGPVEALGRGRARPEEHDEQNHGGASPHAYHDSGPGASPDEKIGRARATIRP